MRLLSLLMSSNWWRQRHVTFSASFRSQAYHIDADFILQTVK